MVTAVYRRQPGRFRHHFRHLTGGLLHRFDRDKRGFFKGHCGGRRLDTGAPLQLFHFVQESGYYFHGSGSNVFVLCFGFKPALVFSIQDRNQLQHGGRLDGGRWSDFLLLGYGQVNRNTNRKANRNTQKPHYQVFHSSPSFVNDERNSRTDFPSDRATSGKLRPKSITATMPTITSSVGPSPNMVYQMLSRVRTSRVPTGASSDFNPFNASYKPRFR